MPWMLNLLKHLWTKLKEDWRLVGNAIAVTYLASSVAAHGQCMNNEADAILSILKWRLDERLAVFASIASEKQLAQQ